MYSDLDSLAESYANATLYDLVVIYFNSFRSLNLKTLVYNKYLAIR